MMKNGKYKTEHGSTATISGFHSGIIRIDFDWLEEDACVDCRPSVNRIDRLLQWSCDYCGGGSAPLTKVNQ